MHLMCLKHVVKWPFEEKMVTCDRPEYITKQTLKVLNYPLGILEIELMVN